MLTALAQINIGQQFKFANNQGVDQLFPSFGSLLSNLLPNLYILAGVISLFLLIFGGLGIIMGAGSGDPKKADQGKQAVTYAIIGLILIFTSFWIIQIIEIVTGLQILNNPTL